MTPDEAARKAHWRWVHLTGDIGPIVRITEPDRPFWRPDFALPKWVPASLVERSPTQRRG